MKISGSDVLWYSLFYILHVLGESKKICFPDFLKNFPQWLGIFNQIFTCLLYVYIYTELHNFIQLSLTLTTLCQWIFIFMAALCNRGAIIFLPCGYYLSFYLSFFISSPNLSGRRLDVYHTSTHGVALVRILNACLKCAARGSLKIPDAKKSPKIAIWAPSHNFVGLYLRN